MKAGLGSLHTVIFLSAWAAANQVAHAQTTHEPPVVTIVATDHHAAETEMDPGIFTVTRTGSTEGSLLVFYGLGGTAQNGGDYQELPRTVSIPAGAASAAITVKPINDSLVEGTETVVATLVPSPVLSPIEPYRVGFPDSDVILLADNDSPDTNQPPRVVIVTPANGAIFPIPANILLGANAPDDGEVVWVEFFAGDRLIARATGPFPTPFGAWSAYWTNPPPGEYTLTAKATDDLGAIGTSAPVRILVTEPPVLPVVTIEATDAHASEIAAVPPGLGMPQTYDPGRFVVSRTGNVSEPLEVQYEVGGTAKNGIDYAQLSGAVTIPAGSASAEIQVAPIDDGEVEDTESLLLTLKANQCDPALPPAPGCYTLGDRRQATVIIEDNDTTPHLPPAVRIIRPIEGAMFTAPADIELVATAQGTGAWIRMVEFFAEDRRLGSVEFHVFLDSFRLAWSDVPAGEYTLTAKATDSLGATAWSNPVHLTVKPAEVPPITLIPKETIWKYLDNGSDQRTAWREPGFNDTEWKSGPAQLGFGDGDEATLLSPGMNDRRFITYYFRRGFEVADKERIDGLTLRLLRDDGALVYLNGTEVFRSNMPDGPITVATLATLAVGPDTENMFHSATIDPHLLVNGRNALAVEVHQASAFSSDVSFDLELVANGQDVPKNKPPFVQIIRPPNSAVFAAPGTIHIEVVSYDADGHVCSLLLFADGTQLAENHLAVPHDVPSQLPPIGTPLNLSFSWTNVPPGEYVLKAIAAECGGIVSTSAPVKVVVIERLLPSVVNIETTDAEGAEINPLLDVPPNPAVFKITRSGETTRALRVYYRLTGTARNGVDYQELPSIVTIPEGASSAEIVVQPIDDSLVEGTESVVATLVPLFLIDPPGGTDPYIVGPKAAAEAHILDNDQPPPNEPPHVRLVRPENGSVFAAGTDIQLIAFAHDREDNYFLKVEFFAGGQSLGVGTFNPTRCADICPNYILTWSNVPPGRYVLTAVATDSAGASTTSEPIEIGVGDHNQPSLVTIVARDPVASEGTNFWHWDGHDTSHNWPTNTATFVVRRTGDTNSDLVVFFSVSGTAENGKDYEALSNSVTIPAGRHTARVVVRPVNDELSERIETVVLKLEPDPSLGPIARYTVGWPSKAVAIIVDNDHPRPNCMRLPDGHFHLCAPGRDGQWFRIEASRDLLDWLPVCTNVVTDGAVHFIDPDDAEPGRRFYRVVPESSIEFDD